MSLLTGNYRSKHYVHIVERDDWWPGQMKHYIWMETHNEDCDSHQCDWDMDWDK